MNSKIKKSTAATFGAAMAATFAAPELQADIVPISFNPGSVGIQSTSVLVNVQMTNGGSAIGSFSQWNDVIGQTLYYNSGVSSWAPTTFGASINQGTFSGLSSNIAAPSSGVAYFAFRSNGNVGWFAVDFGTGVGDVVTYVDGAYGKMGENVIVGEIPAPGALALLAMGAAGIRRKRQRTA